MKVLSILIILYILSDIKVPTISVRSTVTIDSLGACQGASMIDDKVYLYGDREVGVVREYSLAGHELEYTGKEMKLTVNGSDIINHPTGIAHRDGLPSFIGNSIRLNPEGTKWRAVIYQINWDGLQKTRSLDGNLISTVEDDACIQGTRPEYVQYKGKWYVATADYGGSSNEVRLYDVSKLSKAKRTSEAGVAYKKFNCGPWVQNLHWIADKRLLVLVQNQVEGRKWRLSVIDLDRSIDQSSAYVIKVIDFENEGELEGFTFTQSDAESIAVTSSQKNNVHYMNVAWQK